MTVGSIRAVVPDPYNDRLNAEDYTKKYQVLHKKTSGTTLINIRYYTNKYQVLYMKYQLIH